jgi:transcription initiation factor TFIID subunit TAF12
MLHEISARRVIMDDVSNREFYAAFSALGDRLEQKIDKRSDKLEKKLEEHSAEDRVVADRVMTIEVERRTEATQAARRMTWTVFGMTTGATIIVKIVERLFR